MVQNERRGEFLWGAFDALDKSNAYTFCLSWGCTSKECGEFTAIFWCLTACQWIFVDLLLWFICLQLARSNSWFNCDWVTFWKLVSNLYFTCSCWGAIPWIVVRLKSIIQEREFSEYLRNELDALKTRWFGNNAWPTVSMILARHLFALVTVTLLGRFTFRWRQLVMH